MSSILLTDLSRCQPASALSRQPGAGCWRMVDYTTEDGTAGVMLFAAPEDAAPEVTLPLDVTGWHAIYVGINYTRAALADVLHHTMWPLNGVVWMKLTRDLGFSRFAPELMLRHADHLPNRAGRELRIWNSIHETFWTCADLSGQALHIRPPAAPYTDALTASIANVSYVRMERMDDARVAAWQAEQPRPETRCVAVHWCTDSLTGQGSGSPPFHPTSTQWMRDEMVPYVETDVGVVIMEAIRGDVCCFPSRIGLWGRGRVEVERWDDAWINPLKEAVDIAHAHGIELLCGLRMAGANYPVVRAPIQRANHYWCNQHLAIRDRNGVPASHLSLAYPEARRHWLDLLGEGISFGADGVHVILNRSMPFVLYEPPVTEAFEREHGLDPRTLSDDDERWLRHRASYVTQFLREIRTLLDAQPGRRRKLGVTFNSHVDPLTQRATWRVG